MRLIDADELIEYLKKYHGMSQLNDTPFLVGHSTFAGRS